MHKKDHAARGEQALSARCGVRGSAADAGREGQAAWPWSLLSFAFGLALFTLAMWVLWRWASKVTLSELAAELAAIPNGHIALAVLFTFLSFVALMGYEYYACRYIGRTLPHWRIALYSFITQSVAHAVGFAIVVGGTIRYKLYAANGFSVYDVARIQVFFTTTFGLGCFTLAGGMLLIEPGVLSEATGLPTLACRLAGAALLGAVAAVLVWGALFHRPVRFFGKTIILPTARVTLIQILLGMADLAWVAAALWILLPAELGLGYTQTLGIFVAAITIGLISHVPGSLGVFESAVILLVNPTDEMTAPLIGALVAFRAVYYILPLIVGSIAYGTIETTRWLASATAASSQR